ncbi:unnamed protein product, partial [Closterium sp. Naga37s-1]
MPLLALILSPPAEASSAPPSPSPPSPSPPSPSPPSPSPPSPSPPSPSPPSPSPSSSPPQASPCSATCGTCPTGATCTVTSGNVSYCICPPGYGMGYSSCSSFLFLISSLVPTPGPATCGSCPTGATCTVTSGNVPYCVCPPGYGMGYSSCISARPDASSTSITFYDQTNYTISPTTYTMRLRYNDCRSIPASVAERALSLWRVDGVPGGADNCASVYGYTRESCQGPPTWLPITSSGTGISAEGTINYTLVMRCCCAAVLLCCGAAVLLCCGAAALLCCCAAVLRCCCAAVLLCCCAAVLMCCCAAVLRCCWVAVLLCCGAAVLRCCCAAVLLCCGAAVLLRCCAAVLLCCCAAVLLRCCAAVLLCCCAAVPLCCCAAVLLCCGAAALLCCCAAVLRCCCAAVLQCCCAAVLLCCCAALLLCCGLCVIKACSANSTCVAKSGGVASCVPSHTHSPPLPHSPATCNRSPRSFCGPCVVKACSANSTCIVNSGGVASCVCDPGFVLQANGRTCIGGEPCNHSSFSYFPSSMLQKRAAATPPSPSPHLPPSELVSI